MTDDRRFYRPELDALRFLAFAVVFVRHTTSNDAAWWAKLGVGDAMARACATASQAGAFGVYLFFVLSAYLITRLLLDEKARHGRVHLRRFYLRRILRIWPLYFAYLALACGYAWLAGDPIDATMLPLALLFLANWGGIWVGAVTPTANHLWSISVEEQFYVLAPALIAFTSRRTLTWIAIALVVGPAVAIPLGPDLFTYAFMGSGSCFAAFGAGMLIANLAGDAPRRVPLWVGLAGGGACWYAAAALGVGSEAARSTAAILLIVLGAAAMLLASFGRRPHRLWVYLGKISYGLYVFHVLAIAVVERLVDKKAHSLAYVPLLVALELAVTVGAAALSYRYLEAPFLRIKERFAFVRSRPV